MITELYRADNNTRFALRSGHISDRWGWILECLNEEFPYWPNDDVDTAELENGTELITINSEPKAILRYRCGWEALDDNPIRLGDASPRNAGRASQNVRPANTNS